MIAVHIRPGKSFTEKEFLEETPPYSIGLDGSVDAPTFRVLHAKNNWPGENSGPWANYDHHKGCDRFATRATSGQVYVDINMGLFETFKKNGKPEANLWINDVDQDVCLSVWLLQNHERVVQGGDPLINRLVAVDELLDATGGAFPFLPESKIRREFNWIFEPYLNARFSGELRSGSAGTLRNILEAVCYRITQYSLGRGEELELKGQSTTISGISNVGDCPWAMVKEEGPKARAMSFAQHNAFVVHLGEREGKHDYTIARKSMWIPFPITEIYDYLNSIEDVTLGNMWGGSDTIGGSPRVTGSRWDPLALQANINNFLGTMRAR